MSDMGLSISFGEAKIYLLSAAVLISFLWGAYVFFRKALESYFEETVVFDAILLMAVSSFVWSRLLYAVLTPGFLSGNWLRLFLVAEFPGLSAWGIPVGILSVTALLASKAKDDLFDWWDLSLLGMVSGWSLAKISVVALMVDSQRIFWKIPVSLLEALLLVVLFWVLWYLEIEYRTFKWYRYRRTEARSGLVTGAAGLGMALIYGLSMIWRGVNWVGVSIIISIIVASFLIVYTRSGRSLILGKT